MEFIKAQRTKIPQIKPTNLSQKTVLITGSNAGLGFEAARAVVPHNPGRLILAVRNLQKGEVAQKELDNIRATSTIIETRELDQGSFASVRAFVKWLDGQRIDIALLNAGVWNSKFTLTKDGLESDLQVNTVAPALLALLLLPNLRRASSSLNAPSAPSHLTFVSSGLHENARFAERNTPGNILDALNDPKQYQKQDRYPTSKTIGLLWARELAHRVRSSEIVINSATPGFCKTGLPRHMKGFMVYAVKVAEVLLARSAQDGARCLLDAAMVQGEDTHGKYLSEMKVKPESELIRSAEGGTLQMTLWEEIVSLLKDQAELESTSIP